MIHTVHIRKALRRVLVLGALIGGVWATPARSQECISPCEQMRSACIANCVAQGGTPIGCAMVQCPPPVGHCPHVCVPVDS